MGRGGRPGPREKAEACLYLVRLGGARLSAPLAPQPAPALSLCHSAWPVHAGHTARLSPGVPSSPQPPQCSEARGQLKEEAYLGCRVVTEGVSGVGDPKVRSWGAGHS